MVKQKIIVDEIPSIIWGKPSDTVFIFVHGKMSCKEEAELFATFAVKRGCQVLSFDLPEHGERNNSKYKCTVHNAVSDLKKIGEFASANWERLSLFACSLGAYFSLIAYNDFLFEKCLFQSPILDMEQLIKNMMKWFNVSENDLVAKKEISTPIGETLSWEYLTYVRENRITKWNCLTSILYGEKDNFTEKEVVIDFCDNFKCDLRVIKNGEHYLNNEKEMSEIKKWYNKKA